MTFQRTHILVVMLAAAACGAAAQSVDYSVVSVGQEAGLDLMKITGDADGVCLPLVRRSPHGVEWYTNRILAASPDGSSLAFLANRNSATNIFIKDLARMGASRLRTNRQAVIDFSYSPDGKSICFAEAKGKANQLFITDANNGFVCRQIVSGYADYSPVYDRGQNNIYFTRMENQGASIWSYSVDNNYLSSYVSGMNPCPDADGKTLYVARSSGGRGEIWRIDTSTGSEECVVSDPEISFYSPALSPDGRYLLLCGGTRLVSGDISYWNTDIYTCRTDGTDLRQLTYHAADDLSPVWSADGRRIFFISQRGSADAIANVWQISFSE